MWVSWVQNLRTTSIFLGASNLVIVILGGILVYTSFSDCYRQKVVPVLGVTVAAGVKIAAMFRTGIAQEATAKTILDSPAASTVVDSVIRNERRLRYKTWLWWTRFGIITTVIQFLGAIYLIFTVAKVFSPDGRSSDCLSGPPSNSNSWKKNLLVSFTVMVCSVPILQCFAGSDVLRWRSFYATQDDAWKAHYQEVFDHGIREALCCLGRVEYLSVLEEDEVYLVARLLGDLVAYRASGTGHLELLAGLALLQRHTQSPISYDGFPEAPTEQLQGAIAFHKFAEAAYTGPLLDFGRNPILFPCAWLHRQGIFTPWTQNRLPVLDGDNWWRGHAAAFLKYINLPSEVLRRGRVCQEKCKAAYFIVVLHHLRSVVIAIRGTETPEDLITDGLGRECPLSREDLDGLINSRHIQPDVKNYVESSFPHYGHSGIVEAARDLFMQIEGKPSDDVESIGFLSSLLGAGHECSGYHLRIVGHSLGGAIAALLGMRLYCRFPNLHVYAYGPLPCVNSVVANACSEFVTSIVHDNEFSARLSVWSIMRLRAAAITVLSQDSKTNTALIFRLARLFLYLSKDQNGMIDKAEFHSETKPDEDLNHIYKERKEQNKEVSLWYESNMREDVPEIDNNNFINPFHDIHIDIDPSDDPIAQFMETVPKSENGSVGDSPEMFLPGLVIHMVPQQGNFSNPLWKGWKIWEREHSYKAYIVDRESFKDIIVSPSMFLDHLPWRCHQALQKVLGARNAQFFLQYVGRIEKVLFDGLIFEWLHKLDDYYARLRFFRRESCTS